MLSVALLVLASQVPARSADSEPVPWTFVADAGIEFADALVDPQLAVLPGGAIIACYSQYMTFAFHGQHIVRSEDQGRTWTPVSIVSDSSDASLFEHKGDLWLLGIDATASGDGGVSIRRSTDKGATWTKPADAKHGRLRGSSRLDCCAGPAFVHDGRVWRAFIHPLSLVEGERVHVLVASADAESDLLDASNWRWSTEYPLDQFGWSFATWGLALANPKGDELVLIFHSTTNERAPNLAVAVRHEGWTLQLARKADSWNLPQGVCGWRTTREETSSRFFALISGSTSKDPLSPTWTPRNFMSIRSSRDFVDWQDLGVVLHDPAAAPFSFVTADWLVRGEDLLTLMYVERHVQNADGKVHRQRSIDFLRIPRFRERTADSPPLWGPPLAK